MMNRLLFVFLVSLLALSGCSDGGQTSETFPVTGNVQLDGEPIGGVSVVFVPESGVDGRGGVAVTDSSGNFSLQSEGNRNGVPAGKYRVLFSRLTLPDGSPIPPGAMAADVGAENSLPGIYNDPAQTPIRAEVQPGQNAPLEFLLQSR